MSKIEVRKQFGHITLSSYDSQAQSQMKSFIRECQKFRESGRWDEYYAEGKLDSLKRYFDRDFDVAMLRSMRNSEYLENKYTDKQRELLVYYFSQQKSFIDRFCIRGRKILQTYSQSHKIYKADMDYLEKYCEAYLKIGKQVV